MIGEAGGDKWLSDGVVDGEARLAGAKRRLAACHCCGAGVEEPFLVGRWLPADNERIREVASITESNNRIGEQESIAVAEDSRCRWAAAVGRARRNREVPVHDNRLARGRWASVEHAPLDVQTC